MSHNDSTPDQSGTGSGGSSSRGRKDEPEYGQRIEGAPAGPSYEAPGYGGYGQGGDQHSAPQYGQGQYGHNQYDQGQYGQGQYGQGQYDQGQYDQGQYGQGQYGQGQQGYGGQDQHGYPGAYGQAQPGQYGQAPYGQGQYDMGGYGGSSKPAGSGLGIAAIVLGVLALLTSWLLGLGFVPGVVGLILGIVAVRKLGRVPGASKAVPVIGIVLSVLGVLASIGFFVFEISFFVDIMNACAPYVEADDQVGFQQCVNEQMGLDTVPQ